MARHKKGSGESISNDSELAVIRILEKFASILLRLGIDAPRGEDLLRRAFVSQAARIAKNAGHRNTQSQIALLAGVNRLDVRKIFDRKERTILNSIPQRRVERILTAWRKDPDFSGSPGRPKDLSFEGPSNQFEKLIRKYGRDISARALREELITSKLAIVKNGRLSLVGNSKTRRAPIIAALSDLRFLNTQLAPFDFYLGRRAFQTRYLSVTADDIKMLKLIQRKSLVRLEATLSSLESLKQISNYKKGARNERIHRLHIMTIVSSETDLKNKRRT